MNSAMDSLESGILVVNGMSNLAGSMNGGWRDGW